MHVNIPLPHDYNKNIGLIRSESNKCWKCCQVSSTWGHSSLNALFMDNLKPLLSCVPVCQWNWERWWCLDLTSGLKHICGQQFLLCWMKVLFEYHANLMYSNLISGCAAVSTWISRVTKILLSLLIFPNISSYSLWQPCWNMHGFVFSFLLDVGLLSTMLCKPCWLCPCVAHLQSIWIYVWRWSQGWVWNHLKHFCSSFLFGFLAFVEIGQLNMVAGN